MTTQATTELFEIPDEAEFDGLLIAAVVPEYVAGALAMEGGVPAEQMHITLAYIPDADDLSDEQAAAALLAFSGIAQSFRPLNGRIGGVGLFNASRSSDGRDVIYANVDVPGLSELRGELVKRLRWQDIPFADNHSFTPHITLAYMEAGTAVSLPEVPTMPLVIDELTFSIGGRTVKRPLSGMGFEEYRELADICATQPGEENGRATAFFNEVAFAEAPPIIPYMPIPNEYMHPAYGKVVITRERNERFASNFNAGIYQKPIPIDAEHQTKLSGAAGWINEMVVNEDGSVDAIVEWTERGRTLLATDQYKFFSPEWYNVWLDPSTGTTHQDIAVGGAITTRPFFKPPYLRPLVASEGVIVNADVEGAAPDHDVNADVEGTAQDDNAEGDGRTAVADETVIPAAPGAANTHKEKVMSEETQSAQAFAELEVKFNEVQALLTASEEARQAAEQKAQAAEAQIAQLTGVNQQMSEQVGALSTRIASLEGASRERRFADLIANGGAQWFGEETQHHTMLGHLANQFGEDSEPFATYVNQQGQIAAALAQSKLFAEQGTSASNDVPADDKIAAKARELMKAGGRTYEQAYAEVLKQNPELYVEYVAQA
jgi:2'-5' RNA ligase